MSISRWYKFTEDTPNLGTDSSTNLKDLTNVGVTSVTDATYGKVAYFDGSSYFTLPLADIPVNMTAGNSRAMSFWVKPDASSGDAGLITYGNEVGTNAVGRRYALNYASSTNAVAILYHNILPSETATNTITEDSWNHVTAVFSDGGNSSQIYINGTLSVSTVKSVNTAASYPLYIGFYGENSINYLTGCMTDMRFYDDLLDSTAILALYNDGPEVAASLGAVMYTHVADLTWDAVSGASTYRITSDENSSGEVDVDDTITGTSITVPNLVPGTSYEFKLYSDLDPLVSALNTTDSTPAVDATSVQSLLTRFSNNLVELSSISTNALNDIDSSLRDVLSTGEVLETSIGETVFVADTDTLIIPSIGVSVLTPFDELAGSSQQATVTLSDSSTNVVTYDETTNEIISNGENVPVGSYTVIGGYKVSVKEI